MEITNRTGLPQPIINALLNDLYDPGESDITVTQLIDSPRIRLLTRKHYDELKEDAIDRLWSLLGQAVHQILERADETGVVEERLYIDLRGWKVGGQFDRIALVDNALQDYKVTSAWSVINGPKPEWEKQLNCLAVLAREAGHEIDKLEVFALYRDWSRNKMMQSENYPRHMGELINIPMWDHWDGLAYMKQRIEIHKAAEYDEMPDCSHAERWYRGEKWAVMKEGRKTAVKLHDTKEEAAIHAAELLDQKDNKKKYYVEKRPGTNVRCQDYCPVADYCDQWQELKP